MALSEAGAVGGGHCVNSVDDAVWLKKETAGLQRWGTAVFCGHRDCGFEGGAVEGRSMVGEAAWMERDGAAVGFFGWLRKKGKQSEGFSGGLSAG